MKLILSLALGAVLLPGAVRAQIPVVPDWSEDLAGNTGFYDATLGPTRRAVFMAAANYVGSLFTPSYSNEVIRVKASFKNLGTQTVGTGATQGFTNNFGGTNPRYQVNTDYPFATANHLAGRELSATNTVVVQFNTNPAINYDYNTNDTPNLGSGLESLYTTVIHEIVHGMTFINYVNTTTGSFDGFPTIFDRFIVRGSTSPVALTNLSDADRLLAIVSNDLFWIGPMGREGNGGVMPKLFAPNPFQPGSSLAHLDTTVFDPQGLLFLPRDSSIAKAKRSLGPLERGIIYDMGWLPSRPKLAITTAADLNTVAFTSIIDGKYRLRYTTTLSGSQPVTNWTTLTNTVSGTGVTVILTNAPAEDTRYYAVELIP